jgi:Fur family iron response transcriptional regulator
MKTGDGDMMPEPNPSYEAKLRTHGLRPTRQRLALAELLFSKGDRHVSAEALHAEAVEAHVPVSLATIYNALNQFTRAGLLREVAIEGQKTYFDTNTSSHHHFYYENEERLVDIPDGSLRVMGVPDTPAGKRIDRIDVIVRLRDE